MFAKVIIDDVEDLYECHRTTQYSPDDDINKLHMSVYLKDGRVEHLELDKRRSEVYFMNDRGMTIDKSVWR